MTGYKAERLLILGVLALTLLIEVEFQLGIRDFIKAEGGRYLDVYCWNSIYGSGATRDIDDSGWSTPKNYTRNAELINQSLERNKTLNRLGNLTVQVG